MARRRDTNTFEIKDTRPKEEIFRELYESLNKRYSPQDVAWLVLAYHDGGKALPNALRERLREAARYSSFAYRKSSMPNEFRSVEDMGHQAKVASALFSTKPPGAVDNPVAMTTYVEDASREIHRRIGQNDFSTERLNREQREKAGLGKMSRRRYNKLFRLLSRMEGRACRMSRSLEKRTYAMIAKSGLAHDVTWDEFSSDPDTGCFLAYYTARCNMRSIFTVGSQDRAMDTVADALLAQAHASKANYAAIGKVMPTKEILAKLTDEQKIRLLAAWWENVRAVSKFMKETWEANSFNRDTMVVKAGDDSSTWNSVAGAWNKIRDAWVNILYSLGMDNVVHEICPGKAMRLMAGDVAYWHASTGDDWCAPDVKVWRELPFPWEVVLGETECDAEKVADACKKHKVDPNRAGWIAPKPKGKIAEFKPAPELVHGVVVDHPELAEMLRKTGAFSGKGRTA